MAPEARTQTILIGTAGWSYEDWKETVYPPGLKPGDRLAYLARYFDCVEINSTFYATPRTQLVERWAALAEDAPGFLFTCKVNRALTHEEADMRPAAQAFRTALEPLVASGTLGAVLAQYPWFFRFTPARFDRVRALVDLLPDLPLVVEIRHRSFLNDAFLDYLRDRGIGLANIDLPASTTSIPPAAYLFGRVGYFRFHGRNRKAWFDSRAGRDQKYDYLYSESELKQWIPKVREVAAQAERVFVIANNHYRGQAPANAVDVARLLGERRAIPEPLMRTFPHLGGGRE